MNFGHYNSLRPIDSTPFEVVERKGVGHPDTLVDGVAEAISVEYSKYCLENFGAILHHNVDKIAIQGGLVDIDFGKSGEGVMTKPATLFLNGRMSVSFGGTKIDTKGLMERVAKEYIQKILPHMDVEKWLNIEHFTKPYSHNPNWYFPRNLDDIPDIKRPYANDTSTCTGYWPLSIVERLTLMLEGYFYDDAGIPRFDFIGQDIKVMAVRHKKEISITLGVPFIITKTPNIDFYKDRKSFFMNELQRIAERNVPDGYKVKVYVNSDDDDKKPHYYFLLAGSCIEAGEEGVVGRGNRSRGTIASTRPFSMEASHGKNPAYFVGKVHTLIADYLAEIVAKKLNCESNVFISTQVGEDLYSPNTVIVETTNGVSKSDIIQLVEDTFTKRDWTSEIINKRLFVPKTGNLYL